MHHGHIQSSIGTFKSGSVRQPICHPLKQHAQANMVIAPHDFPHNMHYKHVNIMVNVNESTWSLTCGK